MQSLVRLVKQAGGLQEGALSFMANIYLVEDRAHEPLSQGASGLQPFNPKDVSTVPGCIQLVLRDTSR
jgi:hypothetical protein